MSKVLVVGSFVQDLAFHTEHFPKIGETRIGRFVPGPGGKGFNQAVACARQGVATHFIGAVGKDVFADTVRDFAQNEHLSISLQEVAGCSTGAAAIVVNAKGDNEIIVDLGANNFLKDQLVEEYFQQLSDSLEVVLVQAEGSIRAAQKALFLGKKSAALTIFNPAPINPEIHKELLSLADILTPNETEFAFLLRHLFEQEIPEEFWKLPDDTLHGFCRILSEQTVIITLGASGCFVSCRDEHFRVPALAAQALDTTGAGDAFSGGLAAGLVLFNRDLKKSLHYASAVAALSTEKTGTAPAMPHAQDVQEKLSRIKH